MKHLYEIRVIFGKVIKTIRIEAFGRAQVEKKLKALGYEVLDVNMIG